MSIICTRFHFRRIFIIFQVTPIILVILLSFLSRTLHKTWKSHYRQLQVLTMTFNEKAHVNICSISSSKKPWNLLSFVSRTVLNECLKNSVRNCFSFAFDFELLVKLWKHFVFAITRHLLDLSSLFVSSRSIFRTLSNIYGGAFCENSYWLLAVICFRKTLHFKYLRGLWIRLMSYIT